MAIPTSISPSAAVSTSAHVVALVDGKLDSMVLTPAQADSILAAITTIGAPSSPNATARIVSPGEDSRQIVAVCLPANATPAQLREAAGAGVRAVRGEESVTVDLPHTTAEEWAAITEGAALGAYEFTEYKSEESSDPSISIATPITPDADATRRVEALIDAQNAVRTLVNTPASDLLPQDLEEAARTLAQGTGVTVTSWTGEELAAQGCGGIIGVGKGSIHAPRMVRLEWNPEGATKHIALVGKGITFDSGGMSLKSHEGLIDMKTDMTGAATIAAVICAAAKLEVPVRVSAWMCIAENMLSGSAMHVGDVLTMANGTTVEVNNTDAEGRLVLADGLSHAVRENPDEVIDIATLTGAQIRALGLRYAGLMGSSEVVEGLERSAEEAGEYLWAMPLPAYLRKALDSNVADMLNTGGAEGGMLTAGLFLQHFAGNTPWAHIDIAGPSFNSSEPWGYTPRGGTGYAVRTLLTHIESFA